MSSENLDTVIDQYFAPISAKVAAFVFYAEPFSGYDIKLILIWLAGAALFFTVYLGFPNLRYFGHALAIARNKFDAPSSGDGQISSFQALMTSLSGTVGLGNIAGVAVAVSVGGPGAAFWMAVMGVLGMATKFAEASLGVKYRVQHEHNPELVLGGPMYYIRAAFDRHNLSRVGKAIAWLFCLCCIGGAIGGGNMFQANQSYQQVLNVTGGDASFLADKGWLFGVGLAILTGLVILGGIRSIANVSSKIVPFMGVLYLIAGLYVIGAHYENIPHALATIFTSALSPEAGIGAVIGALLMGVQRAAFSNEAGMGSGAIVHAAARTNQPLTQGFVGMLGPFIDTVIICMITALVIVVTGAYEGSTGMEGVALTSRAFEQGISFFPYILALTVFLFAFSTLIAWSYLGEVCAAYIFGENKAVVMTYKIIFLVFIVIGAASKLSNIIDFSDAIFLAMAVPNCIALFLLAPELKRDLKKYLQDFKKTA